MHSQFVEQVPFPALAQILFDLADLAEEAQRAAERRLALQRALTRRIPISARRAASRS